MSFLLECAPLTTPWPKAVRGPSARRAGSFQRSYDATFADLETELGHLNAREAVAEFDMTPKRFRRLDTRPYADGPVLSPRVLLTFLRGDARLVFACDTYTTWLANLRGISLTLTALRAVDRYGASTGEQYRGYRRLGSGDAPAAEPEPMTPRAAAVAILALDPLQHADGADNRSGLLETMLAYPHVARAVVQEAAKRLHPDAGGSTEAFQRLMAARGVLDAHHANGGAA